MQSRYVTDLIAIEFEHDKPMSLEEWGAFQLQADPFFATLTYQEMADCYRNYVRRCVRQHNSKAKRKGQD